LPDEDGKIGIGLYDNNELLEQAVNSYFKLYGEGA